MESKGFSEAPLGKSSEHWRSCFLQDPGLPPYHFGNPVAFFDTECLLSRSHTNRSSSLRVFWGSHAGLRVRRNDCTSAFPRFFLDFGRRGGQCADIPRRRRRGFVPKGFTLKTFDLCIAEPRDALDQERRTNMVRVFLGVVWVNTVTVAPV